MNTLVSLWYLYIRVIEIGKAVYFFKDFSLLLRRHHLHIQRLLWIGFVYTFIEVNTEYTNCIYRHLECFERHSTYQFPHIASSRLIFNDTQLCHGKWKEMYDWFINFCRYMYMPIIFQNVKCEGVAGLKTEIPCWYDTELEHHA